jgi:hypothetical protein
MSGGLLKTQTIVVQQAASPPTSPTSNTVHLPSTPVPKELLNINGQQSVRIEPLNPANIALPPSVASALQSINDKVTRQQRQKQQQEQQQLQVMVKNEPMITLQGSPTGGGGSSPGGGPLFYYLMPGSVPYSLTSESGTTVQVRTSDGSIATAQLVTVPSGSIQSVVQQSGASGVNNTQTTQSNHGGSSSSWIIDGSSPSAAPRNSM